MSEKHGENLSEKHTEKEILNQTVKDSMEWLKYRYGIDNFSNLEIIRLRHVAERIIPEFDRQRELARKKEVTWDSVMDTLPSEIAMWWLDESYGIREEFLPREIVVDDITDDKKIAFKFNGSVEEESARKNAQDLAMELRAKGHNVSYLSGTIELTLESKEYIRRKREEAHQP